MFKKLISIILIMIMIGSLFTFTSAQEIIQNNEENYYVETGYIPNDAIEYAENSIGNMLMDQYDSNYIKLLYPFKIFNCEIDLYYFMVYFKDELIGSYRVFNLNGKYNGIFSEVDEFEKNIITAFSKSNIEQPAIVLCGQYKDVYSVVNDRVFKIIDDIEGNFTNTSYIKQKSTEIIETDQKKSINLLYKMNVKSYEMQRYMESNYLQLDLKEIQGDNNWCAAYCTASIIRFMKGLSLSQCNVISLIEWAYPGFPAIDLKDAAFTPDNVIDYSMLKGLLPTYDGSRVSYTYVQWQINKGTPLYFGLSSKSGNHAVVCRGYNDNSANFYFSIWNPWYSVYEKIYESNFQYITKNGTVYTWVRTIHDF